MTNAIRAKYPESSRIERKKKKNDNYRQKAQHAAYASEDSITNQGAKDIVDVRGRQGIIREIAECVDAGAQQILQPGADDVKGQPENEPHDHDEKGMAVYFPVRMTSAFRLRACSRLSPG